jgi:hypothetical protein
MTSDEIVLEFLVFLAHVRALFRQVHLFAEESPALRDVSTTVIPFKGEPSDYADRGVNVSVALNAEVLNPTNSERKAIGMSLLLRRSGGLWIAEAEVGWTGDRIGWDPFDSKETQATSIDEIMAKITPLVEWMSLRFQEEVTKLSK